jgi:hypothetical protein
MVMKIFVNCVAASAVAILCCGTAAQATVFWVEGSTVSGNHVSASANFTIVGKTLSIVLQNTSPAAGLESPTNTLTGITGTIPRAHTDFRILAQRHPRSQRLQR